MSETATPRFWSKVNKGDGCWLWTGTITYNGYGKFGPRLAHRIAFESMSDLSQGVNRSTIFAETGYA